MCHLFDRLARAVIFIYSSDWKTQLGRRCWDLASCQISLNPVQQFQRRSQNVSANQGPGPLFYLPMSPKNTNLVEDIEIFSPVKFCWIPFSSFRGKVENVSANQRPGGHLVFPMGPKNTKLVEDVEILLLVKFRWIPCSRFRGEVENVSANQRPGRPSCFSDRIEKHKIGRGRWELASCQVSLNSVQPFQRSRKSLSQSEARAAILFFRSAQKLTLGRGRWDLALCQVSLDSVQRFQRRSRKCLSQSELRAAILIFRSTRKT